MERERPSVDVQAADISIPPQPMTWRTWSLLTAFIVTLYLLFLGSSQTLNSRECYVVVGAQEMLATGDLVVPRLAGKPWLEKPPLPQWLDACVGWLGGDLNEWLARLPFALAGLVSVLLVTGLASRWFGAAFGLLTGLVQATTVYALNYASLATSDVVLFAIVTAIVAIFARHFVAPIGPSRWYAGRMAFWVLLGLSQLVKGPLFGAVMALLPCLGFIVWQRQWAALRWLLYWPGMLVGGVLATAWPAAILSLYPEAGDLWWLHTFGRFNEKGVLGAKPFWYYASTAPWQVLPWTPLALVACAGSWRRAWREQRPAERFLALWFALPFAALSVVAGKHPQYLIYALPPWSFWAAEGLLRARAWLSRGCVPMWGCGTVVAATAGVAAIAVWQIAARDLPYWREAAVLGGLATAALAVGLWCWHRQSWRAAAVCLYGFLWLAVVFARGALIPQLDQHREENALFHSLNGSRPVIVFHMDPAQVLYYCRGPIEVIDDPVRLKERWHALPNAHLVTQAENEQQLAGVGTVVRVAATKPPPKNPQAQFVAYDLRTETEAESHFRRRARFRHLREAQ